MNKKILLGIVALAIAGVSVINVNFNSRSNNLSGVSLANVEALAQELPPPPDTGYCCTHFPCYDAQGRPTGNYSSSSYSGSTCSGSYHSHGCSSCG